MALLDDLTRLSTRNARRLDNMERPEVTPQFAAPLLDLPMLRGAWADSVASGGTWHDVSGHGNHLAYNGNPVFNYSGLVGYWDLDGTGDFFDITDAASGNDFDITGGEAYVDGDAQGFTTGGWFWFDNLARSEYLMAKYAGAADRMFYIWHNNVTDVLQFAIFDPLNAADFVNTTAAIIISAWYHVVVRFDPSNLISITLNGTIDTNAAGIPATLQNSSGNFEIGAQTGANTFDGRVADCFACAAYLSDAIVLSLFEQQRAAYNV